MRDLVVSVTGWAFSLLFLFVAAKTHLARGGPQRPKTIISNSGMAPKSSEAALLLLAHAARTLPANARVAVIKPRNRNADDQMLMAAHGLVEHRSPVSPSPAAVEPIWPLPRNL